MIGLDLQTSMVAPSQAQAARMAPTAMALSAEGGFMTTLNALNDQQPKDTKQPLRRDDARDRAEDARLQEDIEQHLAENPRHDAKFAEENDPRPDPLAEAPMAALAATPVEQATLEQAFSEAMAEKLDLRQSATALKTLLPVQLQMAQAVAEQNGAEAPAARGTAAPTAVTGAAPVQTRTEAPQPAPAPSPVINTQAKGWIENVSAAILAAQDAEAEMLELTLTPENLGKLQIRLEMKDGVAQVSIVTQTEDAARLFNDTQSQLSEMLAQSGLTLADHRAESGLSQHAAPPAPTFGGAATAPDTDPQDTPAVVQLTRLVDLVA